MQCGWRDELKVHVLRGYVRARLLHFDRCSTRSPQHRTPRMLLFVRTRVTGTGGLKSTGNYEVQEPLC